MREERESEKEREQERGRERRERERKGEREQEGGRERREREREREREQRLARFCSTYILTHTLGRGDLHVNVWALTCAFSIQSCAHIYYIFLHVYNIDVYYFQRKLLVRIIKFSKISIKKILKYNGSVRPLPDAQEFTRVQVEE